MQPEPITEVDELSGLFRRGAFDRNLADCISESSTAEEPITLIMADLDKFKSINDNHGHPYGDEVLQVIATIIKQTVGSKGRCYRYGGEEISILLKNYSADEAASLAERIRLRIESSSLGSKQLAVTASFGLAEVPAHARTATDLVKAADAALYDAKNLGRNLVRISGEPQQLRLRIALPIENNLIQTRLQKKKLNKYACITSPIIKHSVHSMELSYALVNLTQSTSRLRRW